METPTLITYPLRPTNGGELKYAPKRNEDWIYDPKINGHRVVLHTPTGTMFNRTGGIYSHSDAFTQAAERAGDHFPDCEWLDCEALGFRTPIGFGSLIILDIISGDHVDADTPLHQRLGELIYHDGYKRPEQLTVPSEFDYTRIGGNQVYTLTAIFPLIWDLDFEYKAMQIANSEMHQEFFEGYVAKDINTGYPRQLNSPTTQFPKWIKHRFV